MPDELFNPPGAKGQPLESLDDAIEAAACLTLAHWITNNRPSIVAVELDGQGEDLYAVNAMLVAPGLSVLLVSREDDLELWEAAAETWMLLITVGRADRRVVAASESENWTRGWP